MSVKLRHGCLLSAAIISAQALAFAASAQEPPPGGVSPQQPTEDRDMRSERTQPMPSRTTERSGMTTSVSPQGFATQAAVISKAEIELAQLAIERSQDKNVREFAERMVKDHSKADAKLKKIAAQEQITLPQTLDTEHQAVKQKLSSLRGAAFDREYKKEMAKGHDKAVALFESASQARQMPKELKEFAVSTLRTLEKHQEMAHSLHEEGA